MQSVLFSPVGKSDPIRYFHDGAMLCIMRHYTPDITYLYMSKEILEDQEKDNRFLYCIGELGKKLGKNFDVNVIEKPELDNPHVFDFFIKEFKEILEDIHEKYPEIKIWLNVSSGTPAMKSALQYLSAMMNYTIPIQVSSPQKQSNPRKDDEKNATPQELWELNESNGKDDNRCEISKNGMMFYEIEKAQLSRLVRVYDYASAIDLSEGIIYLPELTKQLLEAARVRLELKRSKATTIFRANGMKELLSIMNNADDLSEYILMLEILCRKKQYGDFIRAITPALTELLILYLQNKCGFNVHSYTCFDSFDVEVWDETKLNGTKAEQALKAGFGEKFNYTYITSQALYILIQAFSDNSDEILAATTLRDIEKRVRNTAAHTLKSINSDYVKKCTNYYPEEIMKLISDYNVLSGNGFSPAYRNSYDTLNDSIIKSMKA